MCFAEIEGSFIAINIDGKLDFDFYTRFLNRNINS